MIETLIASIVSFVGTNIDDIFINTFFYAEADNREKRNRIVLGKYIGIGLLVAVSILGASGLTFIPAEYIRYLGIVPIALGAKEVIVHFLKKDDEADSPSRKAGGFLLNVILITIANGADNIGVYISLFVGYRLWQFGIFAVVFALMILLWCVISAKLSDLPFLKNFLSKYKHIIVPVVYTALGLYILMK